MMYENILLPLLIILCVVTLMYCKKEMKYKNPSIIQREYKKIIWEEIIND